MPKKIVIAEQHQTTAVRLLGAAGIATHHIAGDEVHLVDDIHTDDLGAALIDLEAIALADQLVEAKAIALDVATKSAAEYRRKITGAVDPGRLVSWASKLPWAMFWAANETSTDPTALELINTAREGFEDEAATTGETAEELRDATIANEAAKFRAYQVVEGMERLALTRIPAAANEAELADIVTQLRDLEVQAALKLETLTEGGTNA